jgi:hypothetical protein
MNNSRFDEDEITEKYVAEFGRFYKAKNYQQAVYILDIFKLVPKKLHHKATDAILKIANISPHTCFQIGLKFLTWKKDALPLNLSDRERLLSTILEIATDPARQDSKPGELRGLANIDDPRVFDTLVAMYQSEKVQERKNEIVYGLGNRGKEDAFPILLDYIFRQRGDLAEADIKLLEKYPVSKHADSAPLMDTDDRDTVVTKLIQYLQEKDHHEDALRIAIAHMLAILYASSLTSAKSKGLIQASADIAICYGYDEYISGPVGYIYLKELVNFGEESSPLET